MKNSTNAHNGRLLKSLYVAMGVLLCLNVAVAMVGRDSIVQVFGSVTGSGFGPSAVQNSTASLSTGTTKMLSLDDIHNNANPPATPTLEPSLSPSNSPDTNGDESVSTDKDDADANGGNSNKVVHPLEPNPSHNPDESRMKDESSEEDAENKTTGEVEQPGMRPSGKATVLPEDFKRCEPSETLKFRCGVGRLASQDEIRAMEVDELVAYAIHKTNVSKVFVNLVNSGSCSCAEQMRQFKQEVELNFERKKWAALLVFLVATVVFLMLEHHTP